MTETLDIIVPIGISISLIVLLPIGIILGTVFGLKSSGAENLAEKRKNKRRMWWGFFTPFIVIIFLLIVTGLLHAISSIAAGN